MNNQLIKVSTAYITDLLNSKLTSDYTYHNLEQTIVTKEAALELAKRYNLSKKEFEIF